MRYRSSFYDRVEERHGFKYIKLETGRMISFWDAIGEAEAGERQLTRWLSRAQKLTTDDWDLERIEARLDDLETIISLHRQEIEKKRGIKTKEERIANLRITAGREPEEIALFQAKADELERKLNSER